MDATTSSRTSALPVAVDAAWAALTAGGPGAHWYAAAPFVFRSALDRLLGGAPPVNPPDRTLTTGDRAYFWDVVGADPFVLELEARVRAPGRVTLRSSLESAGAGCRLAQQVGFAPDGALGAAYLLADLPAREVLLSLVHRRTCAELLRGAG